MFSMGEKQVLFDAHHKCYDLVVGYSRVQVSEVRKIEGLLYSTYMQRQESKFIMLLSQQFLKNCSQDCWHLIPILMSVRFEDLYFSNSWLFPEFVSKD